MSDKPNAGLMLAAIDRLWPALVFVVPMAISGTWWVSGLSSRVESLEAFKKDTEASHAKLADKVGTMTEALSELRGIVITGNESLKNQLNNLIRSRQ